MLLPAERGAVLTAALEQVQADLDLAASERLDASAEASDRVTQALSGASASLQAITWSSMAVAIGRWWAPGVKVR